MINIVLFEPEIPQNTGNIARTCACTGANLHLIKPFKFDISDKALKRAGLDYWDKLKVFTYENLSDFFDKTNGEYFFCETSGVKKYSDTKFKKDCYIFFGKETTGLPLELLSDYVQNTIKIPMGSKIRSLNLSNCVAIVLYEALRQLNFDGLY